MMLSAVSLGTATAIAGFSFGESLAVSATCYVVAGLLSFLVLCTRECFGNDYAHEPLLHSVTKDGFQEQ